MSKTTNNQTVSFADAFAAEQTYAGTRSSSADPEKVSEIKDNLTANEQAVATMTKAGLVRTLVRMGYQAKEIAEATAIPYGEVWNAAKKYQQRTAS